MSRRAAALLALFAFAGAWIVGVWRHQPPSARLASAALAALFGAVAGGAIGVALQHIVLARFLEQWTAVNGASTRAMDAVPDGGSDAAAPSAATSAPAAAAPPTAAEVDETVEAER